MISIIVPVYNVEKYLPKCVESLVKQTYQDLEILLIDDGSKDNSGQLCEELAKGDERIKVYHKINGGLSDARNYGIERAQGEYCLLIDSDDYIREDTAELCMKSLDENASDIVVFDMEYVYDDHTTFASGGSFKCSSFKDDQQLITINNSACNKLFKTELLKQIAFPVGMLYEDLATVPALLGMANRVSKVDEALYYYVQRSGSIVHVLNDRVFDIYKAIARIRSFFNDSSLDPLFKELFIRHGLYLTVIRIKDSSDQIERHLKMNNEMLDTYCHGWRKTLYFKDYSFKSNLIFKLLQLNMFGLVKKIYGK